MRHKISILCALLITMQLLLSGMPVYAAGEQDTDISYAEPQSPSVTYNMNMDWKFTKPTTGFPLADASASIVKNGKQFYEIGYDDSDWETVSVPHPINAEDSFNDLIADAGEGGLYRGFMFYRKNITIPASDAGKKMFLEFEAIRQSVYLYVNGQMVGYYEAGIAATGFDITDYVKYGEENLIAVATDNASTRGSSFNTQETKPGNTPGDLSGFGYQWNTKDFNEVQGGITGNVLLYAKSDIYQTLPLYNNLKTRGNYIYGSDFDIRESKATINVEAEVRNETDADKNITLEVNVVDHDGNLVKTFEQSANVAAASDKDARFMTVVPQDAYDENPAPTNADTVDVTVIKASAAAENMRFWHPDDPYLYTIYTVLKDGDTVLDVQKTTTGFRKVSYDIHDGGLKINDENIYLKGYAQRSTNEWAVIGVANDWLTDIDMQLVRESNANFIRWMHVAPKPNAIRSGDKYGVVSVAPAGDKEGDTDGRTWDQRMEAMRDTIIYFRNSPSVIFWEAGNNAITAEHMQEMTDLKQVLDPTGGRYMGCRTLSSVEQIKAAEWVGTMLNRHASGAKASMEAAGKYMPIVETEYAREESPRRSWDDFSPPDFDYDNKWLGSGGKKTDGYDIWDLTQEDFIIMNSAGYQEFYNDRVGGKTGNNYYSAAGMMVWSDSNMHGRNSGTENARTSGRVDPIRVKKETFYAMQVMQSDTSAIHIIGHWNYPKLTEDNYLYNVKEFNGTYWAPTGAKAQRNPLKKTVYVVGTTDCAKVELYVNDQLKGTAKTPTNTFIYAFPNIDVTESGTVKAIAYNARDEIIAEDDITTAGQPSTVKLTPVTGPDGLIADGSDVMYYDVEVIDKDGNVCPLNYEKINFELTGEGVFLGGYNSGKYGSDAVIHKDYVFAECGTNRVFIRSTSNAGQIQLTASMEGMLPVSASITSTALPLTGGLTTQLQRAYTQGEMPPPPPPVTVTPLKPMAQLFTAIFGQNTKVVDDEVIDDKAYTVAVNGTPVVCSISPRKPDLSTGVVGEVVPVLAALKAAGADVTYEETTINGKTAVSLKTGSDTIDIIDGMTTLELNAGTDRYEQNLMNAQIELNQNGVITSELSPIIGYIEGVLASLDTEHKIMNFDFNK